LSAVVDAILFRFTSITDTIATLPITEKIEFNLGTVPDNTGKLTFPSFRMSRDVNIHPNPRRALDQVQDSLLGLLDVRLSGYFISHSTTLGPRNLFNWQVDPATNDELPFGRFGLVLNSLSNGLLNVQPTSTTGYILYNAEVNDLEDPRDEVSFNVQLYRNGAITNAP
jgi:hypothetical protein